MGGQEGAITQERSALFSPPAANASSLPPKSSDHREPGNSLSDIQSMPVIPQESKPVTKREILALKSEPSNEIQILPKPTQELEPLLPQGYPGDHQIEQEPVSTPQDSPITIIRGETPSEINPLMTEAYTAYRNGNFEGSRSKFKQILKGNPRHRGAMLGLAAASFQQGDAYVAADLYLRLLELDPSDPMARANLLAIMPKGDLSGQESELKLLLQAHPYVASLSFSLGNLYASQRRWNEAQDAYFNAFQSAKSKAPRLDMVHPDYPFNLAVSLEHLNKRQLAMKYYEDALELAVGQSTGFDPEALRDRLTHLKSSEMP